MSDSESTQPPTAAKTIFPPPESNTHPNLGGKSLQSLSRPRYKSWRKKYRKVRSVFDVALEDNKRFFREEQKLEDIATRLREELDGLLELSLDLNSTPSLPANTRFDISFQRPYRPARLPFDIPPNITPEQADSFLMQNEALVREHRLTHLDHDAIRQRIEETLAMQDVQSLPELEKNVSHPQIENSGKDVKACTAEEVGYLTWQQEERFLARMDAKAEKNKPGLPLDTTNTAPDDLQHWADLTPRDYERKMELMNPQSQHNWLRIHVKNDASNAAGGVGAGKDADDNESLASHDAPPKAASGRKRPAGQAKNLAKQVGDRAVELARGSHERGGSRGENGGIAGDAWSPRSAVSGLEDDEDELAGSLGGIGAASKVKGKKDPDETYRLKGGKGGGSSSKNKRKRSGEDIGNVLGNGSNSGGGKKAKLEGE